MSLTYTEFHFDVLRKYNRATYDKNRQSSVWDNSRCTVKCSI